MKPMKPAEIKFRRRSGFRSTLVSFKIDLDGINQSRHMAAGLLMSSKKRRISILLRGSNKNANQQEVKNTCSLQANDIVSSGVVGL